jgi:hypothetical protein
MARILRSLRRAVQRALRAALGKVAREYGPAECGAVQEAQDKQLALRPACRVRARPRQVSLAS